MNGNAAEPIPAPGAPSQTNSCPAPGSLGVLPEPIVTKATKSGHQLGLVDQPVFKSSFVYTVPTVGVDICPFDSFPCVFGGTV